jgi:acyl dehydratase
LANQTGFVEGTALAFREINDWKFSKPVFIGDTIHVEMAVKETAAIPSINGGAVTIAVMVKNQRDEIVMKGLWKVLVISHPKASG